MLKVFLLISFLGNIILLMGQHNDTEMINKSSFYIMPKIELYNLTWMVRDKDFSSRLTWDNNLKTGVFLGYERVISNKIFFSELGILRTISRGGTDVDKFSSGAEIESKFQSDGSMFINLRVGAELIKKSKEKLTVALHLAKDNLKLHSKRIPDLNSRYVIRKYNLEMDYGYLVNIANTISEIGIQSGIGYNYAIATWNKIESLKQPKSFDHSLLVYNLGVGCKVQVSTNLSLNILFSNNALISGNERTFLKDGNNQQLSLKTFNNRMASLGFRYRIYKH